MENILLEFAGTLVNNKELSTSYSEFLYCNFLHFNFNFN